MSWYWIDIRNSDSLYAMKTKVKLKVLYTYKYDFKMMHILHMQNASVNITNLYNCIFIKHTKYYSNLIYFLIVTLFIKWKKKNIETRKLTGIDKVHVLLLNENVNSFTLIKVHFLRANNSNILFFCLFVHLALNFTWIHFRIIPKIKFSKHLIQFIKFNCLDGPMKLIDRLNNKNYVDKMKNKYKMTTGIQNDQSYEH